MKENRENRESRENRERTREEKIGEQIDKMKERVREAMGIHKEIVNKVYNSIHEGKMISFHTIKRYNESIGRINKLSRWVEDNVEYKDKSNE